MRGYIVSFDVDICFEVLAAEGVRLVWEGVKEGVPVVEAAFSPRLQRSPLGRELLEKLTRVAPVFRECTDEVLDRLSSVKSHQRRPLRLLPG